MPLTLFSVAQNITVRDEGDKFFIRQLSDVSASQQSLQMLVDTMKTLGSKYNGVDDFVRRIWIMIYRTIQTSLSQTTHNSMGEGTEWPSMHDGRLLWCLDSINKINLLFKTQLSPEKDHVCASKLQSPWSFTIDYGCNTQQPPSFSSSPISQQSSSSEDYDGLEWINSCHDDGNTSCVREEVINAGVQGMPGQVLILEIDALLYDALTAECPWFGA